MSPAQAACEGPDLSRVYCSSTGSPLPERADAPPGHVESLPRLVLARDIEAGRLYRPTAPVLPGMTYERATEGEADLLVARLTRLGDAVTVEDLTTLRHALRAQRGTAVLVRRSILVVAAERSWVESLGYNGLPLDYELVEVGEGRAQ